MALNESDKTFIKDTVSEVVRHEVRPIIQEEVAGLAVMVKRGFDAVDERFDGVDRRLGRLEDDMRDVKFRLAETANRTELLNLTQRVGRLESQVFKDASV